MKNFRVFLMLICLVLVGINASATLKIENNMVKDSEGNKIELKEYKRIIILDPAITETFYMIGAENKIVAIGATLRSKIYPYDKTKELSSVGTITAPSLEKIISYSPDLVVLGGMSTKISMNLRELNIPFIVNSASKLDEIFNNIIVFGHLTGKEKEAKILYNESMLKMKKLQAKIKEKPLKLKGTVLYSTSPMMAFNAEALPGQILKFLGVKNIADDLIGNRPIISQEFLLKENPDFLTGAMSIKKSEDILNANPTIKMIKAGHNNNIFIVDLNKILRGSPLIFIGIEEFYRELRKIEK